MLLVKWEELPEYMRTDEVRPYYDKLKKKTVFLIIKRLIDIVFSVVLLTLLSPLLIIVCILIKLDSKGPIFYKQKRVTQFGREFYIHKFRSMVDNADSNGVLITTQADQRLTRVGKFIRDYKIDELTQLIDVLRGDMTVVGTRPEVRKYVDQYTPEMMATLLLPAGITSNACIYFRDETTMFEEGDDIDKKYIEEILPEKMKWNLYDLTNFSIIHNLKIVFKSFIVILRLKEYK